MININFNRFFLMLIFVIGFGLQTNAQSNEVIPDTTISFPSKQYSVKWILPPIKEADFSAISFLRNYPNFCFSVDSNNNAWLGYGSRIICPAKKIAFKLSDSFKNFFQLNNNTNVISTISDIGYPRPGDIKEAKSYNLLPKMAFQPFVNLPAFGAKVYKFNNNKVCAVVEMGQSSKVYLLGQKKEKYSDSPMGIYSWKELFTVPCKITSLSGYKSYVIFSSKNKIYKYNIFKNCLEIILVLPRSEKINQVVLSDKLMYATNSGVSIIDKNAAIKIIKSPFPRIYCRKKHYYVFLTSCFGAVEINIP